MATQGIGRGDANTAVRIPVRLLTAAWVLTIIALGSFAWILFSVRRDTAMYAARLIRIEELRGVIVHLDEVLTMSARMAALTGSPRWEERYRRFEPHLDAAIKETIKAGVNASNIRAATTTDAANSRLVEMEHRAFALVRAGRKDEAQAVLFSDEYEAQKRIYIEGLASFAKHIRLEFDNSMQRHDRIDTLSILAAVSVGVTACVVWLFAARGLRRGRAQLLNSLPQRAAEDPGKVQES